MMVADLEVRMSNAEFVVWSRYFGRRGQRRQIGLE